MISVIVADDHPVVRTGLGALVEAVPDMTVVAEFSTAEALVNEVRAGLSADVVLLDLRFGEGRLSGAEATERLVAAGGPPVLILTTYDSDADILTAIEAGATGYLLKDCPTDELTGAIRAAAAGEVALGPAIQRRLLGRLRRHDQALTARELDVLQLVAEGASNDTIASSLFISKATVKTHLAHIFGKLDVTSRTEAVAVARRRGIL